VKRRAAAFAALVLVSGAGLTSRAADEPRARPDAVTSAQDATLAADLDRLFADPALARALVGIRIESLTSGRLLYERNGQKLVVPASNMKLLTMSVAAEKLGWDYTFETRLEAAGRIQNGVLTGDLIVVGTGDPSIVAQDLGPAALFGEWASALRAAGIRRVDGRILGDDHAFDDEGLGAGWAWDYLIAAYAAPSGALSYNENVVVARIAPGGAAGEPGRVELAPPGSGLEIVNEVQTGPTGSPVSLELGRLPGSSRLTLRGRIPAGRDVVSRTTTVAHPTRFFVEGLRLALTERGIAVSGGAWDLDDVEVAPAAPRQTIARRQSLPLSYLAGYFMKVSQNFYGEMFLKALGRTTGRPGSAAAGRQVVRDTLASWGVPADAFVMNDGSGLSRYDYVTADTIVTILKHVWNDPRLRGPFLATLPVGAHDGTLETRMRGTILDGRVQAKTGTISNMRALSGYLETKSGERIVFSIIANHFTAANADIDGIVEKALARVAER
jgi:D-alanyl-D-alanine carboxypeptidase/D-alanyl-D-alanine-endopeptidase (penicillin-binding protein 4)